MLAGKCEQPEELRFPVLATPKLDGIRCLKIGGKALTRSFKPVSNRFIREWIEANLPDGVDGELVVPGTTFSETSGHVGRESGEPDPHPARAQTAHAGGMSVTMGDGSVRGATESMAEETWASLCDPRDGRAIAGEW
jgi:hypothetical protein